MENKSCLQKFVAFTYSPYLNVSFLYLLSHSSDRKDPIYIQMFYLFSTLSIIKIYIQSITSAMRNNDYNIPLFSGSSKM